MGYVLSDEGNLLADLDVGHPMKYSAPEICRILDGIVGLVEHGVFVSVCDAAYVATENGVEKIG